MLAGARQSRHDGAKRDRQGQSDVLVTHSVHVLQHQHLAEQHGQGGNCGGQISGIGAVDHVGFDAGGGIGCGGLSSGLQHSRIADQHQTFGAVLFQPCHRRIAHDGQKPGAGIAPGIAIDADKSPQAGFLHDILGVMGIAGQPAGKRQCVAKMRQDDSAELMR